MNLSILIGIKISVILSKIELALLKIGNLAKSSLLVISYFLALIRKLFFSIDGYNVAHKLTNRVLLEQLIQQALSRKDNRNTTTNQRGECLAYGSTSHARNASDRSENNPAYATFGRLLPPTSSG